MPTNEELSDFLAGKIPLKDAEEIDRQVRESAELQARFATLPTDPMVNRLRKVWNRQNQLEDGRTNHQDDLTNDGLVLVDRYYLIEKIGSGGMGQVWKARPVHGVSPPVALKLVKPGLDSKSISERFELERKALAMMDHPCIAKVLDAGSTDQGQSYFVMELVDGPSITNYCHQHQLGIDQRLKLFIQVCRAVQHAHQKGIIHRDLKPSNVLVTQYDGQPLPKVIDFGLAKALGDVTVASDHSQLTEYGALVGTVRYMSPEQVELNAWDIDTRSDIYSLGVVLYELLTGTTPIPCPADGEQSLLTLLQSIRETEPPKPSERLSSLSSPSELQGASPGSQSGIARRACQVRPLNPFRFPKPTVADPGSSPLPDRSESCRAFCKALRRDLDWIVMKAIEKNREQRYQTIDSLIQDIDRYLTGQPVAARPTSAIYRLGKFVKKNRGPVTIAVAACMMVMAGVASLVWSAQANSQRRAVYAASAYSSIINELNLSSVSRHSGWTHRGLELIQTASSISTPLRNSRQLRDWAAALLTIPDVDMSVRKRYAADLSPTDMTFSPSGRLIAVGLATTDTHPHTTIILIDLETDQQRQLIPDTSGMVVESGSDPSVTSLRFGQDDNTLFVGTRNGLLLRLQLDQSPPVVACAQASRGGVLVRLSQDGRYCVTVTSRQQKQGGEHDERMRCFDPRTLEQLGVSEANQRVKSLSIAPDGSRMCISWDILDMRPPESIEYSLPNFERLRIFPGKNAEYHPLGHAVFTGAEATYKRFNFENLDDAAIYLPASTLAWTPNRVPTFQHFQLADNGAILAASAPAENCILFWREAEAIPLMSFRVSGNRNIMGYAISPTLDSMAVITEEALEIYNFTCRQQYRRVISLPSPIDCFEVAPDQNEFATIAEHNFYRYRLPTQHSIDSRAAIFSTLTRDAIAYNPNNREMTSTRNVNSFDVDIVISDRARAIPDRILQISSEPEERFAAHKVAGLGWMNNDHLIAAIDFRLMVWNTNNGQLETAIPQHNPNRMLPSYRAIAVARDQCVTVSEEGTLNHWRWTANALINSQPSIELKSSQVERLAWHPSGDYVIVGMQSGSIQSVDMRLGRSVFTDGTVHTGEICGAAWCDAERLVTASRDGKLAIWRHQNGILTPYVAWDSRSGITAIDISTDGKRCYVASASESISVFDLTALETAFQRLGIADGVIDIQR